MTVELVELAFARVDDAALAGERDERGDAQLGELFDKELAAVALGQRGGDLQCEGQLAAGLANVLDLDLHGLARDRVDAGGVFPAIAVEEADGVAGAEPANRGEVVSLGAGQLDDAGVQRQIDVKSFRHFCYSASSARPARPIRSGWGNGFP